MEYWITGDTEIVEIERVYKVHYNVVFVPSHVNNNDWRLHSLFNPRKILLKLKVSPNGTLMGIERYTI